MSAAHERYFRLLTGSIAERALKWTGLNAAWMGGGKWGDAKLLGVVSSVLWRGHL